MKIKIFSIVLALSILLTSNATASFFSGSSTPTLQSLTTLVSKLSDDIGTMADRILLMADEIGEMADKIGDMSDRIVHTEEMMADLTRDLAETNNNTTTTQVIISSNDQSVLSDNDIPNFTSNSDAPQMLLYISSSLTMTTDTISILVTDTSDLAQQWNQLKTLTNNNKIYVAVKTIDGNQISSLSNVLTYTTFY